MRIFYSLILLLLICQTPSRKIVTNVTFPYDLTSPVVKYILPGYLTEISGIAWLDESILCVQDENGIIYRYNPVKKSVTNKFLFGQNGDYEDIATDGNTVFVLKSNGDLFIIENYRSAGKYVITKETPLSAKNNSEGLVYDHDEKALLIACKGSPSVNDNQYPEYLRSVFRFDPRNSVFTHSPVFKLNLKDRDSFSDLKLFDYFQSLKKKGLTRESDFQPSGIGIHPVTGEFYVISATGKLIIILNSDGKIRNLEYLDPLIFTQPEGICFSPTGELFISNEGRGGYGNILRFAPYSKK